MKRAKIGWSPDTAVTLRAACDLRESAAMKARIGVENRLRAIAQRADDPGDTRQAELLQDLLAHVEALEASADRAMVALIPGHPLYVALTAIRGVGPTMAARIISQIDITKVGTVSALWKWAGLSVEGGEAVRRRKGEKIKYNPRLKTTMFLFCDVQIKVRGPYREDYERAKAEYEAREIQRAEQGLPPRTPMHRHRMAMRKASKLFLSHLWLVWRTLDGLPVTDPYIHTVGGHTNIIRPEERGWPI